MPKYIFKKLKDESNKFDTATVEITVETEDLGEVLQAFEEFLKGSGFHFKGSVDISDEE